MSVEGLPVTRLRADASPAQAGNAGAVRASGEVVLERGGLYRPEFLATRLGVPVRAIREALPFVQFSRTLFLASGAELLEALERRGRQRSGGDSRDGSGRRCERSPGPGVPAGRPPRARKLREIQGEQRRSDASHEG